MGTDRFVKRMKSIFNKDLAVFAFFFFLSFIFWYLNSLSKEIEAGIRYPVEYVNIPRQSVVVEESPARLNLSLKGSGFSVLKLKISGKKTPVLIDFSKVSYKRVPGSSPPDYFLVTSGLTKSFSSQLRSGCEVTAVKPDTLFFRLEKASLKQVLPANKGKNSAGKN